jgi:hypothetical protein
MVLRHEVSRHLRKREYLKDETNEFATRSINKNIRDIYRGISGFEEGYQPRSNLVKDEYGNLLARHFE